MADFAAHAALLPPDLAPACAATCCHDNLPDFGSPKPKGETTIVGKQPLSPREVAQKTFATDRNDRKGATGVI
jgi:hypothetical protein